MHAPCPLFLVVGVVLLLDVYLDDVILPALATSGDLLPQVPLHLREKRSHSIVLLLKMDVVRKYYCVREFTWLELLSPDLFYKLSSFSSRSSGRSGEGGPRSMKSLPLPSAIFLMTYFYRVVGEEWRGEGMAHSAPWIRY